MSSKAYVYCLEEGDKPIEISINAFLALGRGDKIVVQGATTDGRAPVVRTYEIYDKQIIVNDLGNELFELYVEAIT